MEGGLFADSQEEPTKWSERGSTQQKSTPGILASQIGQEACLRWPCTGGKTSTVETPLRVSPLSSSSAVGNIHMLIFSYFGWILDIGLLGAVSRVSVLLILIFFFLLHFPEGYSLSVSLLRCAAATLLVVVSIPRVILRYLAVSSSANSDIFVGLSALCWCLSFSSVYTSYTPPRLFHLSRTLAAGTTAVSYPTYIPVNSIFVTFLAPLLSSFTLGCTLTNELTGTVELPENSTINISGTIGEILLVNFVSIMHLSLTSVLFYVGQ